MKLKLLAVFTLFLASTANAQILDTLYTSSVTHCANTRTMHVYNDTVFFIGNDTPTHHELWKVWKGASPVRLTNMRGIAAKIYTDIRPGAIHLAAYDGSLIFCGEDTTNGSELWKYDMATGSYSMLTNIAAGKTSSLPQGFHYHNNLLYFLAGTVDHAGELYSLNISNSTVTRLTDINPGKLSTNPDHITGFNNKLYMCATDTNVGQEPLEYDINTGKSKFIADIFPGAPGPTGKWGSKPSAFAMLGNKLYFMAQTMADGVEVYCYDGKNAPVMMDMNPGKGDGIRNTIRYRDAITVFKGSLYFCGFVKDRYALVRYDTSTGKTTPVFYCSKPNPPGSTGISGMEIYKNNLYFISSDTSKLGRYAFLKYDGTANPPVPIPGRFALGDGGMIATSHALYFNAGMNSRKDKIFGYELVRYTDTSTANPGNPSGVEEITLDGEVTIYPNPAQDIAHLQLKLNHSYTLRISVTDFNGREVYNTANQLYNASTHTIDIPMHNLPQGNYVYCIKDDTGHIMAGGLLQKL